jgi:alanine dehydrogenase
LKRCTAYADVVVAAVMVAAELVSGDKPPMVVTREMVRGMKPRSLIMDVSIDEGGCVETSRPTTHEHPTYVEEGVIHYCVPNIPRSWLEPRHMHSQRRLPYIQEMANGALIWRFPKSIFERAINTT